MCSNQLLDGDDGGTGLVAFNIVFKLFAELLDEGDRWHSSRVAERAEGAAQHVFCQVLNIIDVFFIAAAVVDAGEGLLDPVRALATRNTPAAGFVLIKSNRAKSKFDNGHGLIEHN